MLPSRKKWARVKKGKGERDSTGAREKSDTDRRKTKVSKGRKSFERCMGARKFRGGEGSTEEGREF